jgi:hypothetical protein
MCRASSSSIIKAASSGPLTSINARMKVSYAFIFFRKRVGPSHSSARLQGQEHSARFGHTQRSEVHQIENDKILNSSGTRQRVHSDCGARPEKLKQVIRRRLRSCMICILF